MWSAQFYIFWRVLFALDFNLAIVDQLEHLPYVDANLRNMTLPEHCFFYFWTDFFLKI